MQSLKVYGIRSARRRSANIGLSRIIICVSGLSHAARIKDSVVYNHDKHMSIRKASLKFEESEVKAGSANNILKHEEMWMISSYKENHVELVHFYKKQFIVYAIGASTLPLTMLLSIMFSYLQYVR